MAYERVNWQDYPSKATPLNADNLNVMDEGIANLDAESESLKAFGNEGKLVYVHDGALDTLEPSNLDLYVGSPTVVTEAAQMTDSSKIYVYSGDETGYTAGDWYSYDGEQWVDRGPFNEPEIVTDKELTVSDRPADGKVVGDAIEALESQLKNALSNIYAETAITWRNGIFVASGSLDSGNGASAERIEVQKVVLADSCRAVILLYDDNEYLGKINSNGTISKASGDWKYFTGEINVTALLNAFSATKISISVMPTDSTTITDETVQEYGDSHCTISIFSFAPVDYVITNNTSNVLSWTWVIGEIKDSGANGTSTIRIRSNFVYAKKGTTFWCDNANYIFTLFKYASPSASSFIERIGYWVSGSYILDQDCYVRIMAGHADYVTVSSDDLEDIPSTIYVANNGGIYGKFYDLDGFVRGISSPTNFIMSINHRGFNVSAPENTLPAFISSKMHGFTYVETDILFTRDLVPVLLHDSTINRTARNADGTEIAENVYISDIDYEQALAYDFGIYKGEKWAGTKIPSLEQFLMLCKNLSLYPVLELKDSVGGSYWTAEKIAVIDAVIKKTGMQKQVIFMSFAPLALTQIKELYPDNTLIIGMDGTYSDERIDTLISNAVALKGGSRTVLTSLDNTKLSNAIVSKLITAELNTIVWTVDSTAGVLSLNEVVVGVLSNLINAGQTLEHYILENATT